MGILNSGTQPIQFISQRMYLRTVHVINSILGRFGTVHRLMLELEGRGFNEKENIWVIILTLLNIIKQNNKISASFLFYNNNKKHKWSIAFKRKESTLSDRRE